MRSFALSLLGLSICLNQAAFGLQEPVFSASAHRAIRQEAPYQWRQHFDKALIQPSQAQGSSAGSLESKSKQIAGRGGISSGGGMGVRNASERAFEIFDFYFVNARFRSQPLDPRQSDLLIPETAFSRKIGYLKLTETQVHMSQEMQFLKARLQTWKMNAPVLVDFLSEQLKRLTISLTDVNFEGFRCDSGAYPEQALDDSHELVTASVFTPVFGAIFRRQILQDAGLETRSALLLHEAFRRVQSRWGWKISDYDLMWFTATLILGRPELGVSLDHHPSLAPYLGARKQFVYGGSELKELCDQAKQLPQMKNVNAYCAQQQLSSMRSSGANAGTIAIDYLMGMSDQGLKDYASIWPRNSKKGNEASQFLERVQNVTGYYIRTQTKVVLGEGQDVLGEFSLALRLGLPEAALANYLSHGHRAAGSRHSDYASVSCMLEKMVAESLQGAYCATQSDPETLFSQISSLCN